MHVSSIVTNWIAKSHYIRQEYGTWWQLSDYRSAVSVLHSITALDSLPPEISRILLPVQELRDQSLHCLSILAWNVTDCESAGSMKTRTSTTTVLCFYRQTRGYNLTATVIGRIMIYWLIVGYKLLHFDIIKTQPRKLPCTLPGMSLVYQASL